MTVLLTIIVRKQFILQHQSSQKYGIILNCLIILSLLTVQSVSTKYCMAILLNIILYQKTTFSAVCRRIEWLLCYRNHYIKQIYIHGLHQTVWSGEMTIIRAVSGHHKQLWIAVLQLISTVQVMMSQDILKVFSINQLVEYYKSSLLLSQLSDQKTTHTRCIIVKYISITIIPQ